MNMFSLGKELSEIPPDSDDIGQSAFVGRLIVEAADIRREGCLFAPGTMAVPRDGVNFKVGKYIIKGSEIGRREVTEVSFSPLPCRNGKELVVTGWIIRLKGIPIAFRAASFKAAA